MKPPPLRNFVPVAPVREADRPRPPTFYQAQPRFSPAPLSHFKATVQNYTPFQSIPEHNPWRMQLPLREVNDFRKRLNARGIGTHYDKSTVAAALRHQNRNNSANDPRGYGSRPGKAPLVGN